jgi:hypothetical protein
MPLCNNHNATKYNKGVADKHYKAQNYVLLRKQGQSRP